MTLAVAFSNDLVTLAVAFSNDLVTLAVAFMPNPCTTHCGGDIVTLLWFRPSVCVRHALTL